MSDKELKQGDTAYYIDFKCNHVCRGEVCKDDHLERYFMGYPMTRPHIIIKHELNPNFCEYPGESLYDDEYEFDIYATEGEAYAALEKHIKELKDKEVEKKKVFKFIDEYMEKKDKEDTEEKLEAVRPRMNNVLIEDDYIALEAAAICILVGFFAGIIVLLTQLQ